MIFDDLGFLTSESNRLRCVRHNSISSDGFSLREVDYQFSLQSSSCL